MGQSCRDRKSSSQISMKKVETGKERCMTTLRQLPLRDPNGTDCRPVQLYRHECYNLELYIEGPSRVSATMWMMLR